jgi:hypothetical protein
MTITPANRKTMYCTMRYAANRSVFEPVPSSGAKIWEKGRSVWGNEGMGKARCTCVSATCVVAEGTTEKKMACSEEEVSRRKEREETASRRMGGKGRGEGNAQ